MDDACAVQQLIDHSGWTQASLLLAVPSEISGHPLFGEWSVLLVLFARETSEFAGLNDLDNSFLISHDASRLIQQENIRERMRELRLQQIIKHICESLSCATRCTSTKHSLGHQSTRPVG